MLFSVYVGHGDERGGMVSLISNEHASRAVKIAYLDVIPWYIPVYLHTLKIENNGVKVIPGLSFLYIFNF